MLDAGLFDRPGSRRSRETMLRFAELRGVRAILDSGLGAGTLDADGAAAMLVRRLGLAPAEAGRLTGRAATAPRAAFTLTADDRVAARPRAPARTGTTPAPATVAWEAISERDLTQPLVPRKIFASSALSGTANERASATAPRGFEGTPCTSMLRAREAATLHTNDGSASWGGRWRCVEE